MSRVARAVFVVVLVAPVAAMPAPAAAPAPARPAPAAPAPAAITPAPVTCADAGVLLARTYATYDDTMISKNEGEIAKACTTAAWPQAVLDCIGSTITDTAPCIAQLSHEQQVALVSSVTVAPPPQAPTSPDDAEDNAYTPCDLAIATPLAFGGAPLGAGSGDDAVFALGVRHHALVGACFDDGWPQHAKECFAKATDADHVMTCMKKLPDEAQARAVTAVVAAEDLAGRTFEARKTAANITCAKVVGKHYADPTWKTRLAKLKAADKRAAITASRTRMTKACTADKWDANVRACVVSGGDYPACAALDGMSRDPWGFPAFGVVVPTGVPACDKYLAQLAKLADCPAEKESRDTLLGMVSAGMATVSEAPDDQKQVLGEACTAANKGIADEVKSLGCK